MTARFVTVNEARVISGISETLINDSDMNDIIEDIEYQLEKYLNSDFTPHVEIDTRDGNFKRVIFTQRAPLLSLRGLTINDTIMDISLLDFNKGGQIRLLTESTFGTFTGLRKKIFIKYVHGRVEWDKLTETTTSSDISVGTDVALTIGSEKGFSIGDWVEIKSFDGNTESSQITLVDTGTITVDELVFDHTSGALIRKLTINQAIKRLIKVWVGISAITRAVGQSFDEITGYTMGEFQVQKGEPFTQFRESIVRLESQAQQLLDSIRPTPGIII